MVDLTTEPRIGYMLQCERVRGEPPYYSVYVTHDGIPVLELTNELSMGCSKRRAESMIRQHQAGKLKGVSVTTLARRWHV